MTQELAEKKSAPSPTTELFSGELPPIPAADDALRLLKECDEPRVRYYKCMACGTTTDKFENLPLICREDGQVTVITFIAAPA